MSTSSADIPRASTVTVGAVIPCKNEVATIERCLLALRAQTPTVFPIVVVDNGSTDGSVEIARRLADRVVELPTGSISELRNRGAAEVGDVDVLAFVDADTEVQAGWLSAGLAALDDGADLVGSRTLPSPDARWVARRWAAVEAARAHGRSRVWSQHLLTRRSRFVELGGFANIPTGEDADLSIRTEEAGGSVRLIDGMVATHYGFPSDVRSFLRRERWHTRSPGWFPRMSRGSRLLVATGAAWAAAGGAAAAASAVRGDGRPVVAWTATSVAALPALGLITARRPLPAAQDGLLLGIWIAVRILRLPRELGPLSRDCAREPRA